jgi:ApbE superfamily uncharacterized protein (UPF0280 family)
VEGSRSLDVMKLSRAGYLSGVRFGDWQWSYQDGSTSSIGITGGEQSITLDYRIRLSGEDWQTVCRSAGRPANSVASGHGSSAMYQRTECIVGGRLQSCGRLFACRHC